MTVVLINPNLVFQHNDPFTTGIVYMPISLAYVAASLRESSYKVKVIDAFAELTRQVTRDGNFSRLGYKDQQVIDIVPPNTRAIIVYAINLTNHIATVSIIKSLKQIFTDIPIIILENTQAVTAYAIAQVSDEFYTAGADFILTGEGDHRIIRLIECLENGGDNEALSQIDGLGSKDFYNPPLDVISDDDLNQLPFPAWDLFPLANYWGLRFAHGPQKARRYMPLLTSRGCPYPCNFCVVPATNNQKWRPRSAINVVDEMDYYIKEYGVHEFHLEDLDPTISDQRIREISKEILDRKMNVSWKIVAGTKVETLREVETIDLMAKAGCKYISISPETGSPRLLKEMRKPFDLDHAVTMVKRMNKRGIRSQACFVLGYPGETEEDLQMTWNLVHDLTKQGVDEIALFIVTPVPGSAIYNKFEGFESLSELNFTPTWRNDYQRLSQFRLRLYFRFLLWKLRYHPLKLLRQPINFLLRRFETKMEMVPYRALFLRMLDLRI